jgi:hypothetical protein
MWLIGWLELIQISFVTLNKKSKISENICEIHSSDNYV